MSGPVDRARAMLAKAVRDRVAGSDFDAVHARVWETPGPRWFAEGDAIWQVHADTSMFIGGIRALLLQSLHPVAMYAVSEHSDFRGDPWGRLQRTSKFIAVTTYGAIEDAEASIAKVRRIHDQIRGLTSAGIPYLASDPDLLRWIHLAEIDSFLSTHQAFGAAPLTTDRADEYVAQTAMTAAKLGVIGAPRSVADLDQQLGDYRPYLASSPPADEATDLLLRHPPLPRTAWPAYAALAAGAIATLPAWARVMLKLPTLPLTDRVLSRPLARAATRTIAWALAGHTSVKTVI